MSADCATPAASLWVVVHLALTTVNVALVVVLLVAR